MGIFENKIMIARLSTVARSDEIKQWREKKKLKLIAST